MMSDIHFRPATASDIDALVELRVAMQSEVRRGDAQHWLVLRESLHRYFQIHLPSGAFVAWVAESDGRIVGTSGMVFHQNPPNGYNLTGREAYIMNMYTVPEFRGRRIAATLLDKLVALAREQKLARIRLHAQRKAKPVYARAGFVETDNEMLLVI